MIIPAQVARSFNLSPTHFRAGSPVYSLNKTQMPAIFLRSASFSDRNVHVICKCSHFLLHTFERVYLTIFHIEG